MIQTQKRYLVGELNKHVIPVSYKGTKTNTIAIFVDEQTKTISGELITDNILGKGSDKAYPGNLGTQNELDIKELQDAVELLKKHDEMFMDEIDKVLDFNIIDAGQAPTS